MTHEKNWLLSSVMGASFFEFNLFHLKHFHLHTTDAKWSIASVAADTSHLAVVPEKPGTMPESSGLAHSRVTRPVRGHPDVTAF